MRPLISITVGYITGIIWGLYLKISIVPIFLLFGGIAYIIFKNREKKLTVSIILFIIFAMISNLQIKNLEEKHLKLYQDIEDINIIGTIISDRKETEYKAIYTIKVETVNNNRKFKNTNLLIHVQKKEMLNYGDKVVLKGNFEKAKQATNYKAFDYREYLKQKNIYGIVKIEKVQAIAKDNLNKFQLTTNNVRNRIKDNLNQILGEQAGIATGILLRRYNRNYRRNNQ